MGVDRSPVARTVRRVLMVAAVVLAALSAVSPAGTASVKPIPPGSPSKTVLGPVPSGFASWPEVFGLQHKLNAAAQRIVDAKGVGYAGIIASPGNRELRVYWKGEPPQSIGRLLDQLRKNVPITVLPARYSERELLAEARRLAAAHQVSSVAPAADGSGIRVSVASPATADTLSSLKAAKVAYTVSPASWKLFSRFNDWAPWWGGAAWRSPHGSCSTGFGISTGGVKMILSAAHCANYQENVTDPTGEAIGYVFSSDKERDTLVIKAPAGAYIYTGGVDTGERSARVTSEQGSFVGNFMQTSGAYSGESGVGVVTAIDQYIDIGAEYYIYPMVMAEDSSKRPLSGNGDSGGSVGVWPNGAEATAMGTITGGDSTAAVPCQGRPTTPSRICSWRIVYADIHKALAYYGGVILTG